MESLKSKAEFESSQKAVIQHALSNIVCLHSI